MSEQYNDQMKRLKLMADDNAKWDLSPYDCSAIQTALLTIDSLTAENAKYKDEIMLQNSERLRLTAERDALKERLKLADEIVMAYDVKQKLHTMTDFDIVNLPSFDTDLEIATDRLDEVIEKYRESGK